MRPIDSNNPIDSTGAAVAPELAPQVQTPTPATASATELSTDASESAGAASKRAESELEANYFRSKLSGTQHDPGKGNKIASPPHAAGQPSMFVGMRLGTNQFGEEVRVKREVGSTQGYDNRSEATAVARMSGAEPAAVLQGMDGKWHAVETTATFYGDGIGSQNAADTPTRQVYGLPSSAHIDEVRQEVSSLKEKLSQASTPAERDKIGQELTHARIQLASLIFGVPESDINFDYTNPQPGKINLVPGDKIGGADGETDTDVKTGRTVTKINVDVLEHPDRAEVVQFHEGVHQKDDELTHEQYAKYQQQTGGKGSFEGWVDDQVKNHRLSAADGQMVKEIEEGGRSATEARAHLRAGLAALQAGHPDAARKELVGYAGMTVTPTHQDGDYTNPTGESLDAITRELQEAYRNLSPAMQQQLKDIVKAAHDDRMGNPEAWISQVKLGG